MRRTSSMRFGLSWGLLYALIFQLHPEPFNMGAAAGMSSLESVPYLFPIFVFQPHDPTTLGYGAITSLSLQARYAAVAQEPHRAAIPGDPGRSHARPEDRAASAQPLSHRLESCCARQLIQQGTARLRL